MKTKPFHRISRPFGSPNGSHIATTIGQCYLTSPAYAQDRVSSVRAYFLLQQDLLRIFEFVEPCWANIDSYSMRNYELLLRAATEFESNCKLILKANAYTRSGNLNISDYRKLDDAMHLSEYELELMHWGPNPFKLIPFSEWASNQPLPWYQSYNTVKHNRSSQFQEANLHVLLSAIAAVLIVLYAQFNILVFDAHKLVGWHNYSDDGWISHDNCVFRIKQPPSAVWTQQDCYSFDQDAWMLNPDFDNYPF